MSRVALVTCRVLPEPDPDQEPLLEALRGAGLEAELLAWDDPAAGPAGFDLCVLRSSWNYYEDPEAFFHWCAAAAAASRLVNPPELVAWNLHKRYLEALERRGLPVVPTAFVERGEAPPLGALRRERGWGEVVIKPAISAASYSTRRFLPAEAAAAQAFLDVLSARRDVMIQPYLEEVARDGERAVIWIDGEPSHTVVKSPRFSGQDERVSDALPVAPDERDLLERALSRLPAEPLYARLDLFPGPGGDLLLSELELMEPSLFLVQHPPALDRFTRALARLART